jgi:hemoglobin
MESLYDHAGGGPAFEALAAAHHVRCLADPELNHPFSHDDNKPDHVQRLATYWAEVMGGPAEYSAHNADPETAVLRLHACGEELAGWGERFAACFASAMDDAGLPDDEAFRGAMTAYMDWAVGRVMAVMPGSAEDVRRERGVPRWSWDGLVSPSPQER